MNHEKYMQRCIRLAKKASGNTWPNPLVGSVIVRDGLIIGEGYHQKAGEAHAEINAINSVKKPELLAGSTIYVSLEPCAHFGRTPPCALKLKEIGFKQVVIGAKDYYEEVNGKGIQILEEAGIDVISGILEEECLELNKRFFTFHQKKRPYVVLKWAQSADGFMDKNFKPFQIGNPLTKQFVHQLRNDEQAILVGTATALKDNPELTTREISGKNPVRLLIDLDLKVPTDFKIFNNAAKTIVFNSEKNEELENIQYIKIDRCGVLEEIMDNLYQLKIQSVLVEGGAYTLQSFINAGLWDEAIIIKNPNLLLQNGTKAPELLSHANEIMDFAGNNAEFYKNYIR